MQRHLHAIYAVEAPDVREFLVPPELLPRYAPGHREAREWVLVRERRDGVDIGVYLDPRDVERVESLGPQAASEEALPALCNVTEGVSHFLLLFRRAARDEPVSLLELEAQAEVDKYVTVTLHRRHRRSAREAEGPRAERGHSEQLRRRLFREARLADGLHPEERERYTEAARLADRYCARLEACPDTSSMLGELRRFYRLSGPARMARLRNAA